MSALPLTLVRREAHQAAAFLGKARQSIDVDPIENCTIG